MISNMIPMIQPTGSALKMPSARKPPPSTQNRSGHAHASSGRPNPPEAQTLNPTAISPVKITHGMKMSAPGGHWCAITYADWPLAQ